MMSFPGEFSPAACGAHSLGPERATCRAFSMDKMQETVFSPCSTSKLHVHGCFLCQSVLTLFQSALTLSEQKLVRKWAWLDSRITVSILAMPGRVAVCILESEKPTGPEIQYVKVILR